MALFPRKVNGRYAMLSRQDNENIYLMYSDMLHFWFTKELLMRPTYTWEYVQLGNCGSPIETEAGWLVLTHGEGPVRRYTIGAILLDLENPAKIIGRLREPLLSPDEKKECLEIIENYRNELVPLIVPVTLLNHYVRKFDVTYLREQYYLNPHPMDLKLRNHA